MTYVSGKAEAAFQSMEVGVNKTAETTNDALGRRRHDEPA